MVSYINIIRVIKSGRLRWVRIEEGRNAFKIQERDLEECLGVDGRKILE
jgi:hypothetical protein